MSSKLAELFSFSMLENWILNDDVGGLGFGKNLPRFDLILDTNLS